LHALPSAARGGFYDESSLARDLEPTVNVGFSTACPVSTLRRPDQNARVARWGGAEVPLEDGCAMIELILTVCALSAPGPCNEQRLQFASEESLMQCMMQAPPYIAQWIDEHPATRVTRWRCAFPGDQKI
jgi:hypothetical protein